MNIFISAECAFKKSVGKSTHRIEAQGTRPIELARLLALRSSTQRAHKREAPITLHTVEAGLGGYKSDLSHNNITLWQKAYSTTKLGKTDEITHHPTPKLNKNFG